MARSRMNGKCDFARALGVVAFLPGDPNRARPRLRGVEEVDAHRGEVPVLESEPVRTGRERLGRRGEFHLNDSPSGAKCGGGEEFSRGDFQRSLAPIQAEREIAFQHLGIRCRFARGNRTVAVPVNQGEHLFGDRHAGREMDLQPDTTGLDGHKRRLQILVKPMGEHGGRKRK